MLGLTIQKNLKWHEHIFSTVSKASKRLHILHVLRRGGVSAVDLTAIYVALTRSILEYCCVVWHNAASPAICLTILEEYKSELCVSSTLDKHTKKHYSWLAALDWTHGAKISVWRPWCRYIKVVTSRNMWPRPRHAHIIFPSENHLQQSILRIALFRIQYLRLTRNRFKLI